ncbi:MAG: 50S ribosomal protein L4 [Myxococcales bacterium]
MPQIDVYNLARQKVGEMVLDDAVFAAPVKEHLYWEVVRMQLANRRSGTANTKTRSEVKFSTRKLFKQKGTGRARRGSRRAPTLKGGGTILGPKPRDFSYTVPKKVRKAALRSALTGRLVERRLVVVDRFELPEIKTKALVKVLSGFDLTKTLVVDGGTNRNLKLSARNLRDVKFLAPEGLNVYDVLRFDAIVLSQDSIRAIEGALKP